jgi:hypothetical protein
LCLDFLLTARGDENEGGERIRSPGLIARAVNPYAGCDLNAVGFVIRARDAVTGAKNKIGVGALFSINMLPMPSRLGEIADQSWRTSNRSDERRNKKGAVYRAFFDTRRLGQPSGLPFSRSKLNCANQLFQQPAGVLFI